MVIMTKKYELEKEVGHLLKAANLTIAVAESCTGGLLGHKITSVSGSSEYFLGGVIAYSNDVKIRVLGIGADVIRRDGAVSETVASQMAISVRGRFVADLGVGVTGVAGPTGGSNDKPVGLVYVALADGRRSRVCRFDIMGKNTPFPAPGKPEYIDTILTITNIDSLGKIKDMEIKVYNTNGLIAEIRFYEGKYNLVKKNTYKYNKQNMIIEDVYWDVDLDKPKQKIRYEFEYFNY